VPIVVSQTVTVTLSYAKATRCRCQHCGGVFLYVSGGTTSEYVKGMPYVSVITGGSGLAEEGLRRAKNKARAFASDPCSGHARCTECHRYQPWMISSARAHGVLRGVACGFVVAVVACIMGNTGDSPIGIISCVLGSIGGGAVGFMTALNANPHSTSADPRSKSESDFTDFVSRCNEEGADPITRWWIESGNSSAAPKHPLVCLGVDDQAGGSTYEPECYTRYVLSKSGFLGGGNADPLNLRRPFGIRAVEGEFTAKSGQTYDVLNVQIKGEAPVRGKVHLGFALAVVERHTKTGSRESGEGSVGSRFEGKREPGSTAYHDRCDMGVVEPGASLDRWTTVFGVVPQWLVTDIRGDGDCVFRVWALDLDQHYVFRHGICVSGTPIGMWEVRCDTLSGQT